MEYIAITYLIAWPLYVALKLALIYKDRNLRFNNNNTRLAYIKEAGEHTLFSYQTLLWGYLLALHIQ